MKIFSSKGFFASKIKDIAQEVDMAQGLVYHYYNSKDEIFYDVINNALEKMNEAVTSLLKLDLPPHEKIKKAMEQLLLTIEKSDEFNQTVRIIINAMNSTAIPDSVQNLLAEKRGISYETIAAIVDEGQQLGTVNEGNPYEMAITFWTLINGLAVYRSSRGKNSKLPDSGILLRIFLPE